MTKPRALATTLGLLAALFGAAALAAPGASAWACAWIALACGIAAVAYATNRPRLLGKRGGRLVAWRVLPLLPYLLAYRIGCAFRRFLRRHERPWDEVAPGLYVGGRVVDAGLPPAAALVVDLTGERSAPAEIRARPGYRSLPVLDGSFPADEGDFLELLAEIAAEPGGVYLHCESGRGRAPTVAAVVLLARGVAADADAAIEHVRKHRPQTRPTRSDLDFVRRLEARLAAERAPAGCRAGR